MAVGIAARVRVVHPREPAEAADQPGRYRAHAPGRDPAQSGAVLSGSFMRLGSFVVALLLAPAAFAAKPWEAPFSPNVAGIVAESLLQPTRKDQGYQLLFADTEVEYDKAGLETLKHRLVLKLISTD